MGISIHRFKILITAIIIFACSSFNSINSQCPPEVNGIADITVTADLTCNGIAAWTEPTYSLMCNDFTDGLAHINWSPSGPGTILTMLPTTLEMQAGIASAVTTEYCITFVCGGELGFDWSARMWNGVTTGGTFAGDQPGYSINGIDNDLANAGTTANGTESNIAIADGDQFCFYTNSDAFAFFSELTITNLDFDPAIQQTSGIVNGSTQPVGCYDIEYTVCDCNFVASTCTFEICIEDQTGPTVTCAMDIDISCIDIIPAPATTVTEFIALDGVSNVTDCSGLVEAITSVDNPDPATVDVCVGQSILRTYTFSDLEGNQRQCGQWINVDADVIAPMLTTPGNIGWGQGLACGDMMDPHALDLVFGEGFPTIADNCKSTPVTPAELAAAIPAVWDGAPVVVNDCTVSYTDAITVLNTCIGPEQRQYRIDRTWNVVDQCGNTDDLIQIIRVGDNMIAPIANVNASDINLILNGSCEATLMASQIEDGSTDDCADNPIVPFDISTTALIRLAGTADPFVTSLTITSADFDLTAACPASVNIELQVEDACGNTATATKIITVEDNTDPVITTCPLTETFEGCSQADIMAPHLPFSDVLANATEADFTAVGGAFVEACEIETITYIDVVSVVGCPNPHTVLTRTWTLTDQCGNTATCDQTLNFEDTTAPMFVGGAENIGATQGMICGDDVDPHTLEVRFGEGFPTVTASCDGADVMPGDFAAGITAPWDGTAATVNGITISYVDDIIPHPEGVCSDPTQRKYRIQRFWTIVDECGNSITSNPVPGGAGFPFQRININDGPTAPTAMVTAADINLDLDGDCEAIISAATVEMGSFDNCGLNDPLDPSTFNVAGTALIRIFGSGNAFVSDLTITAADFDLSAACPATIVLEMQVTDECGNAATATKSITVADITNPLINTCPMAVTIEGCDEGDITAPHLPFSVTVSNATIADFNLVGGVFTENCTNVTVTYVDQITDNSCPNPRASVTRTWTLTDDCGNIANCDQVFTINDTTDPIFVDPPENIDRSQGITCGDNVDPHALEDAVGEGFPDVMDNCIAMTIMAVDFYAAIPAPWDGTAINVNGITISYTDNVVVAPQGVCAEAQQTKYRIQRTWTIVDECGNSVSSNPTAGAGFDYQRINVTDGPTAPTAMVTGNAIDLILNGSCEATISASAIEDGSFDNCGLNDPLDPSSFDVSTTALIRVAGTATAFVSDLTITAADFDLSAACPATVTIELQVSDECGNTGTALKDITVEDTTDPIINTCPPTANLEGCDETSIMAPHLPFSAVVAAATVADFNVIGGVFTENCTNVTVTYIDQLTDSSCPNPRSSVTRTWTLTDDCGHIVSCDQIINISDNTAPTFVDPPQNVGPVQGLSCGMGVDPHSLEDQFGEGFPDIMDNCLTSAVTATEFYNGITAPWDGTAATVGGIIISYTDIVVLPPGGVCSNIEQRKYRIERTWTIVDECGNSASSDPSPGGTGFDFQRINVVDGPTPPTAMVTSNDIDLTLDASCQVTILASDIEDGSFDNCGINDPIDPSTFDVSITAAIRIAGSGNPFSANLILTEADFDLSAACPASIMIELQVEDECGNTGTALKTITVVDSTSPVIDTCPPSVTLEGCDETAIAAPHLPYSATVATATEADFMAVGGMLTENCSNLAITYSDVITDAVCPNPRAAVTRTWVLMDVCGNVARCEQMFTINDNTDPMFVAPPENIDRTQGLTCGDSVDPHSLEDLVGEGFPDVVDNCAMAPVLAADFYAAITAPWDGTSVSVNGITISYADNIVAAPQGVCTEAEQRKYRIERTWTIVDGCGNSVSSSPTGAAGFDYQRINITDGPTAPTAMVTASAIDLILDVSCQATISASTIEDGSFDNCGINDPLDPSSFDVSNTALIRVAGTATAFVADLTITAADFDLSAACPATVSIELQVTDECGNTGTTVKDITVEDTTDPIINTCPPAVTLEGCDETAIGAPHLPYSATSTTATIADFNAVGGVFTENCSNVTISYIDLITDSSCPNPRAAVTRTWTLTDDCGNTTSCSQMFTINDTTAPSFVAPPENIDITQGLICGSSLDPHALEDLVGEGFPDVTDNCIASTVMAADFYAAITAPWDGSTETVNGVTISYTDNIIPHPEGICTETEQRKYRVERTWTISDVCGNVVSSTPNGGGFDYQRINVADGPTAPTAMVTANNFDLILDANCSAMLNAADIEEGSFDNCGINDPLDPSTFDVSTTAAIRVFGSGDAFAAMISTDDMDFDLSVACPATVTIELRVTDECGNTGTATKDITVVDNIAPVPTCPSDMVFDLGPVVCDTVITYDNPMVTDNCDNATDIQLISGIPSGGTFPIGTWTQVFEVTDDCGNTATCSFDITVNEYVPDGLVCKDVNVSLDDNCEANITPDMLADLIGCVDNYAISLVDDHGNTVSNPVSDDFVGQSIYYTLTRINTGPNLGINCTGEILIELKQKPDIVCEAVIVSACSGLDMVPLPTVNGDCSTYTVELRNEVVNTMDCDPLYVAEIIRTYIAIDAAGNESDPCEQSILLERVDLSSFECPTDTLLECSSGFATTPEGYPHPSVTGYPTESGNIVLPGASEEYCNSFVDFEDQLIFEGDCKVRIMRFWNIREWWCTGELTFSCPQIIEIQDTLAPVLVCPSNLTISTNVDFECIADVTIPGVTAVDACNQEDLFYQIEYPGGFISGANGGSASFEPGIHEIIYTVTDKCNNTNSCSMTLTVVDDRQPVAICDFNSVVSLSGSGTATVLAVSFDDGSWDDCGIERYEVARMETDCNQDDLEFGPSVQFCCSDLGMNPMVALRVTDYSGNTNTCMVAVEVQDKIRPELTCLDNVVVDCTEDLDINNLAVRFGLPTVTDSCSMDAIVETVTADINQCGKGTIIRLFTLTDPNGFVQTCTQTITLIDNTPFTVFDIDWPDNFTTDDLCSVDDLDPEDLALDPDTERFAFPTFPDDECSQIGFNYVDEVFDFTGGSIGCFKIIRSWKLINWCDTFPDGSILTFEYEQELKINNTMAPMITGSCADIVECTFDDECRPGLLTLSNTAEDDCTDSIDLSWTYIIDGNMFGFGNEVTDSFDIGMHTIVWTVSDRCGNTSSCTQNFEIRNCKSPIPICRVGLSSSVEAMDLDGDGQPDTEMTILSADFFNAGTYHNCDNPVVFSFSSDINDTEIAFDCDDIGMQPINMWVTDLVTGAQDFCETFVDIQDNNDDDICPDTGNLSGRIAGQIFTEERHHVEDVEVSLQGSDEQPDMTDFEGRYAFPAMPYGGDYKISPDKDNDYLNGVSTLDLVLIQRHILGLQTIDSPYKLIAADVNRDDRVSALDLIDIRKLILGIYDKYPLNESWRFIDEDFVFADPTQPWLSGIYESYDIWGLDQNMNVDFIAMKVGDVNSSATVNLVDEVIEKRSSDLVELVIKDEEYKKGNIVDLQINAESLENLEGFQFALSYDKDAIEIIDIISGQIAFGKEHYSIDRLAPGILGFSWNEQSGENMFLDEETPLLEVRMVVNEDIQSGDIFKLDQTQILSEAYKLGEIASIEMRTEEGLNLNEKDVVLYQNTPNPWINYTEIKFYLPASGKAELKIYSSTGQMVKVIKNHFERGLNVIPVSKENFPSGGMYTYELNFDGKLISKRMIVLN